MSYVSPDVILKSGRVVSHVRGKNGAQLATPTTGPEELTESEWSDYAKQIAKRAGLLNSF